MKLSRKFYIRKPLEVAKDLINKELVHITKQGLLSARIVEVEAYGGGKDLASHGFGNKKTERNKIMFNKGGYVYTYMIYGMYYCFNIVTYKKDIPAAVLIRAAEPIEGIGIMKKNRKIKIKEKNFINLTNGPGKLSQAMGFNLKCYGEDLCSNRIYIRDSDKIPEYELGYTPRINIDYAGDASQYPWRIVLKKSKFLSKKFV